jgi:hypothetical protein
MISAIRADRDDASLSQGTPMRFTVIALVQAKAAGLPFAAADANAINRFEQLHTIMPVGRTEREIQWMTMSIDDQMALYALNFVLAGVARLIVRPFFDLMTLAS